MTQPKNRLGRNGYKVALVTFCECVLLNLGIGQSRVGVECKWCWLSWERNSLLIVLWSFFLPFAAFMLCYTQEDANADGGELWMVVRRAFSLYLISLEWKRDGGDEVYFLMLTWMLTEWSRYLYEFKYLYSSQLTFKECEIVSKDFFCVFTCFPGRRGSSWEASLCKGSCFFW